MTTQNTEILLYQFFSSIPSVCMWDLTSFVEELLKTHNTSKTYFIVDVKVVLEHFQLFYQYWDADIWEMCIIII